MTKNQFPPIIEPSLLSCDFGKLADEAKRAEDAGADALHLDVMDGHFVRNFALSPKAVAAVNRATDLFLDVHIMIYNPFDYIERFVEAGADRVTFHIEATEDVEDTLNYIRRSNIEAGLAFCPDTSESFIPKYLDKCDLMLMMTVNPGFGGQAFLPQVLEKICFTRDLCDKLGLRAKGKVSEGGVDPTTVPPFNIQVDGGIDAKTAKQCLDAGANVFVSGTHLFNSPDMKKAIQEMKELR
jgi:ribulose-phosphate 3-epimerase